MSSQLESDQKFWLLFWLIVATATTLIVWGLCWAFPYSLAQVQKTAIENGYEQSYQITPSQSIAGPVWVKKNAPDRTDPKLPEAQ